MLRKGCSDDGGGQIRKEIRGLDSDVKSSQAQTTMVQRLLFPQALFL